MMRGAEEAVKGKKHQHHEEHIDETWLIPYADLLTLLLALFIILFASSQVDSKKYDQIMQSLNSAFAGGTSVFEISSSVPISIASNVDSGKAEGTNTQPNQQQMTSQELKERKEQQEQRYQAELKDMQELKQKLDAYISENGLTTALETKLNEDMLKITIRDNALFQSGSAVVKPEAKLLAATISTMLSSYPNYNVEVAGYTDNVPIRTAEFETNWDLSAKRSLNFMKILMQNNQIDPSKYRAIGYGEYQPIETNDTAEGRSKNRRVEVNIIRQIKAQDDIVIP
jgi:chemotaxis protein MotB